MKKVNAVIAGATLALGAAFAITVPASAATPNIQEGPCTSGTTTWVHLDSQVHGLQCFGFQGVTPVDEWANFISSGNNCGSFDMDGVLTNMRPGLTWTSANSVDPNNPHIFIQNLDIVGWVGHGC